MFVALNDKGGKVNLMRGITKSRNGVTYYCPHCREPVIMKCGQTRLWHFAHQPLSKCLFSGRLESAFHAEGKKDLYVHFNAINPEAELEAYLPEINQRPDVYFTDPLKRRALEFQCASVPEEDIQSRTKGYLHQGIDVLWVLGGKRFRRKGRTFRLSRMDQQCIRASFPRLSHPFSSPYQLYFYCPHTKLLLTIYNLRSISIQTFTGSFHYQPLHGITADGLFSPRSQPSQYPSLMNDYLNHKRHLRIRLVRHIGFSEKFIHRFLYSKGLTYSMHPGWVGLPHSDYLTIETPSTIWQAWIYAAFLYEKKRTSVTVAEILQGLKQGIKKGYFKTRQLNCRHASITQAVFTYVEQLCILGILRRTDNDSYQIAPTARKKTYSLIDRYKEDALIIDFLDKYKA